MTDPTVLVGTGVLGTLILVALISLIKSYLGGRTTDPPPPPPSPKVLLKFSGTRPDGTPFQFEVEQTSPFVVVGRRLLGTNPANDWIQRFNHQRVSLPFEDGRISRTHFGIIFDPNDAGNTRIIDTLSRNKTRVGERQIPTITETQKQSLSNMEAMLRIGEPIELGGLGTAGEEIEVGSSVITISRDGIVPKPGNDAPKYLAHAWSYLSPQPTPLARGGAAQVYSGELLPPVPDLEEAKAFRQQLEASFAEQAKTLSSTSRLERDELERRKQMVQIWLEPSGGNSGKGIPVAIKAPLDQSKYQRPSAHLDPSETSSIKAIRQNLESEAELCRGFCHPNLLWTLTGWQLPPVNHGGTPIPIILSEFYGDGTLARYITAHQGRMKESEAVDKALQIIGALQYLHARNRLHLDVKPGNVLLRSKDLSQAQTVCLIDFGTCISVGNKPSPNATPGYAAPELLRWVTPIKRFKDQIPITPSADVYSLGVLIYTELTMDKPLPSGSIHDEKAMEIFLEQRPVPIKDKRADINPKLAKMVDSMLEKESKNRPKLSEVQDCLAMI